MSHITRFYRTTAAGKIIHKLARENGSMTLFGLFMLVCMIIIGGLALDVANAYRVRTHIMVAGDSAAHAALVVRELNSENDATNMALAVAEASLPAAKFGDSLRAQDVYFGTWDEATQAFTHDSGSRNAVMVDTARLTERGNSVSTYLLGFIGLQAWDVRRPSVFVTYRPTCFREGFVGEDVVYTTTGNHYMAGFCIHSNTAVGFNTDNVFETGVIVSMPDERGVILPSDGFTSNTGLDAALRDGSYKIRILQRVNEIIAGVRDPSSPYFRDYIVTGASEVNLSRTDKLDSTKFTSGRIHTIWCNSPTQKAKIHAGTLIRNAVIATNCELMFGENVGLEDVTIVNASTSVKSYNGASGIRLGRDDNCGTGGGAQLVTMGGVKFPQYLQMYGGQILAAGDVSFTADANGIQGASIISGGTIDGTTDSVMAFCDGAGMEYNFEAEYFRLAY